MSENIYECEVFEPSPNGGEFSHYIISNNDKVKNHLLNDGIHYVSLEWYSLTLNIGLHIEGVVPELSGGASNSQIKLRFHKPDVSIRCNVKK